MPRIDSSRVHDIFMDCLFRDNEIVDGKPTCDFVEARGVMTNVGFHPERLKSHKEEIIEILGNLPNEFISSEHGGGGGYTFLNMCQDADGEQWTGQHRQMDELVCLAVASGAAEFPLPRDMWGALPGGMPYICLTNEVEPSAHPSITNMTGP